MQQEQSPTSFINDAADVIKERRNSQPDWLNTLQEENFNKLNKSGLPTTKDEDWKYTNVSPIFQHQFKTSIELDNNIQPLGQYGDIYHKDEINLVFINGHFAEKFSTIDSLPEGLSVKTLKQSIPTSNGSLAKYFTFDERFDAKSFIALNNAFSDDAALITIAKNTKIDKPIHIVHYTHTNEKVMLSPRTIINAEKSSQAHIVESYLSFSNDTINLTNALTEIHVEENANLDYVRAQSESLKAFHISNTRVWQETNSVFNGFSYMSGASLTRNDLDIVLNGEGIHSTLNGLYANRSTQHVDNHTSVDHRFPNCESSQLYKGLLYEGARAVFNGKIFVKPIAQQTNSYQLNKNLLLGDKCRVDTKPQLEIFADDVKCTHGATIGQLDEDEIFYLQSRAIGLHESKKMLSKGFVDEIIETINNDMTKNKLECLLVPIFHAL